MIEEKTETELAQLEQAIMALEDHRTTLGDAVVDVAQVSVRKKYSAVLEAEKTIQQRKLATVLFMDVVGSTSIRKDLDQEDALLVMDTALRRLANPIYAHGGRVTRYKGDGFEALFGAPVDRENDPEMGIRAGLQILAEDQF